VAKSAGLAPKQLRALARLTQLNGIDRFYLAGGSAIAFHLRHRTSRDLDLFARSRTDDLELFRRAAEDYDDISLISATDVAMKMLVRDIEVDVVRYRYPPLARLTRGPGRVWVASLVDLATMKLAAISRRGIRRDFWDLQAIIEGGPSLSVACRSFVKRFGKAEADLYHVIRSLTYFDDADAELVFPVGLSKQKWKSIKVFFEREGAKALLALKK
jgi:hypothetical protein